MKLMISNHFCIKISLWRAYDIKYSPAILSSLETVVDAEVVLNELERQTPV